MTMHRPLVGLLVLVLVSWSCAEAPSASRAGDGGEASEVNAATAANEVLIDCLEAAGAGHDDADHHDESDGHHDEDVADISAEEHAAMEAEGHDDSDGHHDDVDMEGMSADMSDEEHAAMGDDAHDDLGSRDDSNGPPDAEASVEEPEHVDPPGAAPHSHGEDDEDEAHDDSDGHHDDVDMEGMSAEEHAVMEDAAHDDSDGHHEDEGFDPCADVVASLAKGPVDRVIKIDMDGLHYKPNLLVIQPGETVRFEITNSWIEEHEFRFTNAADAEAHIAGGHQHAHEVVEGFHVEGSDLLALIQPGEALSIDVTFDGSLPWSIVACMIPGHYEEGMWAELYMLASTL